MTGYHPTRAEVSTLHGILTRLEWIEREYLDLPDELRESMSSEFEADHSFMPLLEKLITTASDMVNIAEERKAPDATYQPTGDELRRYSAALDRITRAGLLDLPLETKAALKGTTDFKTKLKLLEEIASTI